MKGLKIKLAWKSILNELKLNFLPEELEELAHVGLRSCEVFAKFVSLLKNLARIKTRQQIRQSWALPLEMI